MEHPFTEDIVSDNIKLRYFTADIDPDDLKWHYDEEDRIVNVMGETDWQFQFDNKLPIHMNQEIIIPKGVMHRIIKGSSDLNIMIKVIEL